MNTLVQPDPGLYIWTIVTFLVLLAALAKFAWRPLLEALDRRQDMIRQSLDDAHKAKQELERLNVESQRILAAARTEADEILSNTRSDANRFREELKQKAQAEAAGIVKNAERQIELETARALQQIRTEAVDISVAIASKLLERNGIKIRAIHKIAEGRPNAIDLIINKEIDLIINTPMGKGGKTDEGRIRAFAVSHGIHVVTSIAGAQAAVQGIEAILRKKTDVHALQDYHPQYGHPKPARSEALV